MPSATREKYLTGSYSRKEVIQGVASFLFFIGLLVLGSILISTENAQNRIVNAGIYGPLVLIVLKAATNVIAPLTGNPIYLSAAPLFGFIWGSAYLIIGDLVGYTISFFLSRIIGRRVVLWFFSDEKIKQLDDMLNNARWKSVLVLGGLLISFADFASYGAGLTSISFWRFLLIVTPIVIFKIFLLMVLGEEFVTNQSSFLIVVGVITILPVVALGIKKLITSR